MCTPSVIIYYCCAEMHVVPLLWAVSQQVGRVYTEAVYFGEFFGQYFRANGSTSEVQMVLTQSFMT